MSRPFHAGAMALVALWAVAPHAAAQTAEASAQNPSPINTVILEAGKRLDRLPGGKDESFYSVTYHGTLVRQAGTPFKYATALDPDLTAPPEAAGDRNKLLLRMANRSAVLGGTLLEAEGVEPIRLAALEKLDLRGTAAIASNDTGTRLSIGLEAPPLRIPGLAKAEVTNWLVLGVNARRTPAAEGAPQSDHAVATVRAFVGKAFGWRKAQSADVTAAAIRLAAEVLRLAPTRQQAEQAVKIIEQNLKAGAGMTTVQRVLKDAVEGFPPSSTEPWQAQLKEVAIGAVEAMLEQATVAAYVESTGWYGRSDAALGRQFKNLLTATVDYWFLPGNDATFLRLRYEHGTDWTAPTQKRKQWMLALSVRL